jgi:hypothetical protein
MKICKSTLEELAGLKSPPAPVLVNPFLAMPHDERTIEK